MSEAFHRLASEWAPSSQNTSCGALSVEPWAPKSPQKTILAMNQIFTFPASPEFITLPNCQTAPGSLYHYLVEEKSSARTTFPLCCTQEHHLHFSNLTLIKFGCQPLKFSEQLSDSEKEEACQQLFCNPSLPSCKAPFQAAGWSQEIIQRVIICQAGRCLVGMDSLTPWPGPAQGKAAGSTQHCLPLLHLSSCFLWFLASPANIACGVVFV